MQVPMPLVPSHFSLQTAPVQRPEASNVASSTTAPRRSTTSPPPSANRTEQPTPPTARNSRSSVLWATLSNCPRRSCAPTSSAWVSRREGARFVGSSACKWPERRHEAASPEFALVPPARTSRTVLAWTALSERPMSPPSPTTQQRARYREVDVTLYHVKHCAELSSGVQPHHRRRRTGNFRVNFRDGNETTTRTISKTPLIP